MWSPEASILCATYRPRPIPLWLCKHSALQVSTRSFRKVVCDLAATPTFRRSAAERAKLWRLNALHSYIPTSFEPCVPANRKLTTQFALHLSRSVGANPACIRLPVANKMRFRNDMGRPQAVKTRRRRLLLPLLPPLRPSLRNPRHRSRNSRNSQKTRQRPPHRANIITRRMTRDRTYRKSPTQRPTISTRLP